MVMGELEFETDLLVIGGGPGGYAAAFRAADLGLDVTLVELSDRLGGVCLLRGCIPSKTLLHATELLQDAREAETMGLHFGNPQIDLAKLRGWKNAVISRLAGGLSTLAKKRGVEVIRGRAEFDGPQKVRVHESEVRSIKFKHAIIATGSRPIVPESMAGQAGGRVMTSTSALELVEVPPRLLVVGGGYVGLELGSVYASLGSRVTVVEKGARLLSMVDADLVAPLQKRLAAGFEAIYFDTAIDALVADDQSVEASFNAPDGLHKERFDRVLVAIGRSPNTLNLGLDKAGVETDGRGFIVVDEQMRSRQSHLFAIGDVVDGAMLAHKATREGKVAAEVIAGNAVAYDVRALPAVVYTDPQIAWCGLSEQEAREKGIAVTVQRFPWKMSGRAVTMNATAGLTKIIADQAGRRILGMGICGRNAEGLIAEGVLAVEMGALLEDLALSVHPHPTLSETESEAAELFLGSATHIWNPTKRGDPA